MDQGAPPPAAAEKSIPPARRHAWKWLTLAAALAVVFFVCRARHGRANSISETPTAPSVAVVKVTREDVYRENRIAAEFRPYAEVTLNAKVSGYLERIDVDIGDKVKAGQLLATLEVPELRDQLDSAMASELQAEVDYTNSHLISTRMTAVNQQHPNLVAEQDLDTAQAKSASAAATIAAARAEVEKYLILSNYTRITAPFDGVITWRYADPGALIQAGTASDTQAMPLVRISDNYRLRLDVPVSVEDVKDIHTGDQVDVEVESLSGKTFTGKISRTTQRVETQTRTMITELEVPNPDLEIVPGMYARVLLKLERHSNALAIPIQAVSGEKNPTVYVVNAANEIESRPVTLGLETPDKYEITSGLKEGELVMIGSRSLVHPGEKVETRVISGVAME